MQTLTSDTNLRSVARRPRETELLSLPDIRAIVRRARVSPIVALAVAELSGLLREAR